ncbi:hypothetical protein DDZ16_05515 [Marinilabilia rubra]|uniref:Uncharacterized protein n=1 Tax=Marinilabilia rubra TaxID=2162893 RepID=A0A2U2BBF7_9BACT|nr:hypothetical protein DDZ16_05515 [Marinilabilia rubra]
MNIRIYSEFFIVLKGQPILAQWQRLGIRLMILIVGLKAQLSLTFSFPYRAKNKYCPILSPGDAQLCPGLV